MAEKKPDEQPVEPPEAVDTPVDEPQEQVEEIEVEGTISDWEFRHRPPTTEDVLRLLDTLPDVHGVRYVDYADFVQALPQTKKLVRKVKMPNGSFRKEDEFYDTWALYMSVAGRMKMLLDAAQRHGWRVDFEPEPVTPTGIPGMLQHNDGRIVYREYVVISAPIGPQRLVATGDEVMVDGEKVAQASYFVAEFQPLGRKPGTAWVPYSGGKQAAGSNPYEKVETSARGRAIAAWGFGVLPGSGIASLEEMSGAAANQRAMEAQENGQRGAQAPNGNGQRKSREELVEEALTLAEEVRQARGLTEEGMRDKVGEFLHGLGIKSVYDAEAHSVDWQKVKDGQVQLLVNSLADTMRQIRAQEPL